MTLRVLLLAVLAALLAAPAPADAAVSRKKSMWGPGFHEGVSQFPIYADLGAGIWQRTFAWHEIAADRPKNPADPADPAYRWPAELDREIAEAARYGITVSLSVLGTPRWANGGRAWQYAPRRPADYADFVEAAARRYPQVRHWMIWIEPSKAANFQPLQPDRGRPLPRSRQKGPRLYARMLDAAYARLKRVNRANLVIGGNTYTVGAVAPLRYVKALRLPNGRPPRMDMFGHNPFTLRTPDLKAPPLGDGFSDFSDLDQFARALDRHFRKKLPIFISEFTLPTDHPNWELNFYLDRPTQADWIRRALRITRGWKRIYTFGYLSLYDDAPRPDNDQVERGLITQSGERKPAYEAFKRG